MSRTRLPHDANSGATAGREFTADDADLLCAECLMLNRGMVRNAWFTMKMWNFADIYRVVVTTAEEEVEIEFYKLTGSTRFWRDGVEVSLN